MPSSVTATPRCSDTWLYWELKAVAQRQVIPEFDVYATAPVSPWRKTTIDAYGIEPAFGVSWFRRVKTQVSWRLDKMLYQKTRLYDPATGNEVPFDPATDPTAIGQGVMGIGRAALAFDWRAREFAVMSGTALGGALDIANSTFRSDFDFWKASGFWEQGIKIFRRHNFVYSFGGAMGHNLPLWWESTGGGKSLRGYLEQQYRGDTQIFARAEYHFPLFSIGSLDFRALGFYDFMALWYRELPTDLTGNGYLYRPSQRPHVQPRLRGPGLRLGSATPTTPWAQACASSCGPWPFPWWGSTRASASRARSGDSS